MKRILVGTSIVVILALAGYLTASQVWGFPVFGAGEAGAVKPKETSTVSLGQFITNLKDDGRFIRATIECAVVKGSLPLFNENLGKAKTDVYALLRSKTYSGLCGDEGLQILREDIAEVLSEEYPGAIKDVYFSEFIIQ